MKVIAWFLRMFHYYVVFSKAILFISGLIFSYSFVGTSLFSILIVHLSDMWKDYSLPKFVQVVNLQEGSYGVFQIFFAYVADAYSGLFPMLLCSTIIYIIALCLCFITSRPDVFYIALVLMTLSEAAKNITLQAFLGDQLLATKMVRPTTEEEEERAQCRSKMWWKLLTSLAAIASFFLSLFSNLDSHFRQLSKVSAIAMGVGFIWFLLGTKFYTRSKPTGSPLTDVVFVIYAAIINRNIVQCPEEILPRVAWLRWLDKAAVVAQDQVQPAERGIFCSVEQVKEVKFLLKMLPLWTTFLTFSLVEATGSTFFLEEAYRINDHFPLLFFIILQGFTQFIVAVISDYVTEKLDKKNNKIGQKVMLLRIGIGMISCVLCCICAWINALQWFHLRQKYSDPRKHTTIFRLVPQYLLLGIMGGLSEDGLQNFFDSQVSKSMSRYGPPFGECVMGVGKFLSIVCTLFFSRMIPWIKRDIDSSRLDKYYAVLTVFSMVNMIIFWILAYRYGDERFFSEDQIDLENIVEALVEGSSFGYNVTENTSSEQSQAQVDSVPLLNLKTGQETNVSSSSVLPMDEAVRVNPDVLMLNERRSFSRPSSKGIQKRFYSMR